MSEAHVPTWPFAVSALGPTGFADTSEGVRVAYYDLGGDGPDLLLAHATGFCAAVFVPLAAALSQYFHCTALDFRAHGVSSRPSTGDFDWHGFATDVLSVVDHIGLRSPAGFGHSCGGAALVLAEEARPGTFSPLYCYEPVIYPKDVPLPPSLEANPLSAGALRRRSTFSSRDEALANFSEKPPFDSLRHDVLTEYVDNGFAPQPDGSIRLRCRREDEAQIYAHGFSHDAFARMGTIGCRVALACGEHTDAFGEDFLERFARRLRDPSIHVLSGLGHFGPLEDPEVVAASVKNELGISQ